MAQDLTLTLRELRRDQLRDAARLVGRSMSDNPTDVRAFAIEDTEHRCRALARFFVPVFEGLYARSPILGAFSNGALVGVCGMARPGFCQAALLEKLRVLPAVVCGNSLGTPLRVLRWAGEWTRRDPVESHWHLGPVAVDRRLQGQGIGTSMLQAFCAIADGFRSLSYLETDKRENVRFYEKFGFTVIGEAEVLGVANWFMLRPSERVSREVRYGRIHSPTESAEANTGRSSTLTHQE